MEPKLEPNTISKVEMVVDLLETLTILTQRYPDVGFQHLRLKGIDKIQWLVKDSK